MSTCCCSNFGDHDGPHYFCCLFYRLFLLFLCPFHVVRFIVVCKKNSQPQTLTIHRSRNGHHTMKPRALHSTCHKGFKQEQHTTATHKQHQTSCSCTCRQCHKAPSAPLLPLLLPPLLHILLLPLLILTLACRRGGSSNLMICVLGTHPNGAERYQNWQLSPKQCQPEPMGKRGTCSNSTPLTSSLMRESKQCAVTSHSYQTI